jgi:hypothetical protein
VVHTGGLICRADELELLADRFLPTVLEGTGDPQPVRGGPASHRFGIREHATLLDDPEEEAEAWIERLRRSRAEPDRLPGLDLDLGDP